ncbi:phosphatidylglycerophosphate phosphatase 1, chloroplastic/mitochondrial isoform X3 [Malania oleifera]|uniref:phosphatidylglycerophosphate phosphatase 1, chloroplastic/mitochondrial isoform X3 n=1 Tax=Malania oleifera TaxID=397392 RepID=UPI0025AE680B|nr:phosphatidylglycerophosphate phosphatase 1, chloroplastic/mitochondrial isoform X3 [Malania oleifera]
MRAGTVASWPVCCYPSSSRHRSNLSYKRTIIPLSAFKIQTQCRNSCYVTHTTANSCSKEQGKKKKKKNDSHPCHKHVFLEELYPSIGDSSQTRSTQEKESVKEEEEAENKVQNREVICTNMWWADLRAALGQRFNLEGIVCSVGVVARHRHLAVPHVTVPDIRYIDWVELRRRGFRGVVFDKDNTITAPYALTLWGPLESSIEQCKSVFGNDIAVFSNSAGLHEYDPDGRKAGALERAIGIKVIRHRVKKPSGTAEEIEKHFGCASSLLIMVGDRHFTDIVYGNRNGFLTILTKPLSLAEEPFIVKQLRKLEVFLVNQWSQRGLKITSHIRLPDALQCVKDPPPLKWKGIHDDRLIRVD